MDNHLPPAKKNYLSWGLKKIALPILIAVAIIFTVDLLRMPEGKALQQVSFTTLEQKTIHFDTQKEATILYFWGSWCVFCRHTSPTIEKLYQQGYPVVSIAMQSGTNSELKDYLQKHQLYFPVVNDQDGKISQTFAVAGVPTIAIVENGKISLATSGYTSEWGLKFRLWLAKLLHN